MVSSNKEEKAPKIKKINRSTLEHPSLKDSKLIYKAVRCYNLHIASRFKPQLYKMNLSVKQKIIKSLSDF